MANAHTARPTGPRSWALPTPAPRDAVGLAVAGVMSILLGLAIGTEQYLLLAAIPGLVLVGLALFRPHVFLGLSLLLYSLLQVGLVQAEVIRVGPVSVNASQLYVLMLLSLLSLGMCFQRLIGQLTLPALRPSMRAQMMLSIWLLLCLAYSPDYQAALGSVARNLADLVVFYAAYALAMNERRVSWIGLGVVGSALIAAVSSLVQSSMVDSVAVDAGGPVFRAGGTFSGSVQTGTICFAGLAIFVSYLPQVGSRARWLCLGAIGISGLGMLTTLSRTAILGVVLFACLLAMGRSGKGRSRSRAKYIAYAALTLAAITVAIRFTPEEAIRARTADLPVIGEGGLNNPTSGSGRSLLWQTTIEELGGNSAANWLVGHGVNGVSEVIEREMRVSVGAHNSLLQILFDAGLIGLALYIAGAFFIFGDLKQAERSTESPLNDSVRIWRFYMIAYFMSTEMFNAYVYILGPRFLTFIVLGVYLARAQSAANESRRHAPPPDSALRSNNA